MRPTLVIFDVDGVLVDSEPISLAVLTACITEAGAEMTQAEVERAFKGTTLEAVVEGVEERLGRPLPRGFLADFVARRDERFAAELQPVPGAAEAVAGVRALGLEACVASQGRVEKSRRTLGLTGLRHEFPDARIFSATMVERPKPAPDLFLHAARTLGHEPARCVVVEDTTIGVRAAVAAGMRAIAYGEEAAEGGGVRCDDLRELPRLLV